MGHIWWNLCWKQGWFSDESTQWHRSGSLWFFLSKSLTLSVKMVLTDFYMLNIWKNPRVSHAIYKTENQQVSPMPPEAAIQGTPCLKLERRETELNLVFQEWVVIMTLQIISFVEGRFQSTEACWLLVAGAGFITVSSQQGRTALGRLRLVQNHWVRGRHGWSKANQHCPRTPPVVWKAVYGHGSIQECFHWCG